MGCLFCSRAIGIRIGNRRKAFLWDYFDLLAPKKNFFLILFFMLLSDIYFLLTNLKNIVKMIVLSIYVSAGARVGRKKNAVF